MSIFGNGLDLGPQGGGFDGFVSWTSQGSDDGVLPRRSWSLSMDDGSGRRQRYGFDVISQSGVAIDIRPPNFQYGWELNEQHMPKPLRSLMPAGQPFPIKPGDGYKKCLSLPISDFSGRVYLWQQGGWTAFSGLEYLAPQLQAQEAQNPGLVPVVQMQGAHEETINGKLLAYPLLVITQWITPEQAGFKPLATVAAPLVPATPPAPAPAAPMAPPAPAPAAPMAPPAPAAPAPAPIAPAAPAPAPMAPAPAAPAPAPAVPAAPPMPGGPVGAKAEF
jgi:hypothetical protein